MVSEIAMAAESDSPSLSETDPTSSCGETGSVLGVQGSGPHSCAKSQEDDVSPRE